MIAKELEEIPDVCRSLYDRNMLAGCDGNISIRMDDSSIWITPSGQPKRKIQTKDLCQVDLDGTSKIGTPSSELKMHMTIYRNCPKAKAVVHAHPPTAIAWSVAHPELTHMPVEAISELILAIGSLPIAPYALPGTEQMGEHLLPFLPEHRAIILARHGAITWGESLEEAELGMERIEHSAQILATAQQLGGITPLGEKELEQLYSLRKKLSPHLY